MIDTTRRGFLTGMLAIGTVAGLSKFVIAHVPTLYGDLIHDDTEALQALLDGKPIIRDGQILERDPHGVISLIGGSYRVSDTLHIRHDFTYINGGYFKMVTPDFTAFQMPSISSSIYLSNVHVEGAEAAFSYISPSQPKRRSRDDTRSSSEKGSETNTS